MKIRYFQNLTKVSKIRKSWMSLVVEQKAKIQICVNHMKLECRQNLFIYWRDIFYWMSLNKIIFQLFDWILAIFGRNPKFVFENFVSYLFSQCKCPWAFIYFYYIAISLDVWKLPQMWKIEDKWDSHYINFILTHFQWWKY